MNEVETELEIDFNFRCSSSVGKSGGQQNITLGPGCFRLGTVLHEMMHALGIVHEQSRPDRDDHIEVLKENIEESKDKYLYKDSKVYLFQVWVLPFFIFSIGLPMIAALLAHATTKLSSQLESFLFWGG